MTGRPQCASFFKQDQELSDYYNHKLAGGKWNHMMDQTHIGYTGWQQPRRNNHAAGDGNHVPEAADFGVAVEGSASAGLARWPRGYRL